MKSVLHFLILCSVLMAAPALAQDFDLNSAPPFDPDTRTGTLDNGLRWYIKANAEPKDRASLRLVVNAGSILEDDDQQGLAHFLEHMAFNGTENFEKQALIDYLESIGMEFGPEINAYTSFDETVYMLQVPTDDADILANSMLVLADWSRRITCDAEEVDKERGVVVEEWRTGRGARQRIRDEQIPLIYYGSKYAERLPIGDPEIVKNAPRDRVVQFYEDWYRPDLMAVIAVGDFDVDDMQASIEKNFNEDWGPGENSRERVGHEIPNHPTTLAKVSKDAELPNNTVRVTVKKPHKATDTLRDYRLGIVEGLYDGMFAQRLREITEKPNPPFTFAGMGGGAISRDRDSVYLFARSEDGKTASALEAVLVEAKRVAEHGFTETELDRQKKQVLRSVRRQYQERDKTRSDQHAGRYVSHFLDGSPVVDAEWRWAFYQEIMPTITLDEVNALVTERDLLVAENRVVLASVPDKEGVPVPTEGELLAVFDKIASVEVKAYEDEVSDAPLLATLPEAGSLKSSMTWDDLGIASWTFMNGVTVYLKSTDFKEDEFTMSGFSPGGRSLGTMDLDWSINFASMMVEAGGAGEFSNVELGKKLAGKRARLSPNIGTYEEGVRGGGSPEDLETVLQLLWLHTKSPRKDEDAVSAMRQRYGSFFKNRKLDPSAVYSDTMQVAMSNGHPWGTPLQAEVFDDLDLDRAYEFFNERFEEFDNGIFVFVGNLDRDIFLPLAQRYLGSLPTGREETWRDIGFTNPEQPIHKVVKMGVDEKSRTTLIMQGEFEWNRWNRFAMGALSKALKIRLREVIREDLSGTYGVSVSMSPSLIPEPEWAARISFGADPERLDELVGEAIKVLTEIRANGVEQEVVEKVREQYLREHEENLRQNSYWASVISFRARHGLDQAEERETLDLIESLDAEMLAEAAAKYLPVEKMHRFDLLPEE